MAAKDPIKMAFQAGILYRIDSACWWGKSSKVDPDEIDAPPDIMRGVKTLVDPKHLSMLHSYKSKGERCVKKRAFQFLGLRGVYYVPKAFIDQVDERLERAKADFDEAVDEFVDNFPKYKKEWQKKSGEYYDKTLYPDKDELRTRFRFDWSKFIVSVPSVDLGILNNEQYKKEVEKQKVAIQKFLDNSLGMLSSQFFDVLCNLEERLKGKKPIVGKTLKSVQTFVETFKPMNITGNAGLEKLVERFEIVAGEGRIDAKELNKDNKLRTATQGKIKSIVNSFKTMVEKDERLKRSMQF